MALVKEHSIDIKISDTHLSEYSLSMDWFIQTLQEKNQELKNLGFTKITVEITSGDEETNFSLNVKGARPYTEEETKEHFEDIRKTQIKQIRFQIKAYPEGQIERLTAKIQEQQVRLDERRARDFYPNQAKECDDILRSMNEKAESIESLKSFMAKCAPFVGLSDDELELAFIKNQIPNK